MQSHGEAALPHAAVILTEPSQGRPRTIRKTEMPAGTEKGAEGSQSTYVAQFPELGQTTVWMLRTVPLKPMVMLAGVGSSQPEESVTMTRIGAAARTM